MTRPLRVLIVEDVEDDAGALLVKKLEQGVPGQLPEGGNRRGDGGSVKGHWDIVISDYAIPGFRGMAALEICRRRM